MTNLVAELREHAEEFQHPMWDSEVRKLMQAAALRIEGYERELALVARIGGASLQREYQSASAAEPKCPCGIAFLCVEGGGYVPVCDCAARARMPIDLTGSVAVEPTAPPFPVRPRQAMQGDESYVLSNLHTATFLLDQHSRRE